MRVIIAGSRDLGRKDVDAAMDARPANIIPTLILSGAARGVDRAGEEWAREHHVAVKRYPAQWETQGRQAGYLRNKVMAENADALVAVWDGVSRGTEHMIGVARERGLVLFIWDAVAGRVMETSTGGRKL